MSFPKLEILKHVFNRPTIDGVFGEIVKMYINWKKAEGKADPIGEVEGEVLLSIKDLEKERKDKGEDQLRVKTAN